MTLMNLSLAENSKIYLLCSCQFQKNLARAGQRSRQEGLKAHCHDEKEAETCVCCLPIRVLLLPRAAASLLLARWEAVALVRPFWTFA